MQANICPRTMSAGSAKYVSISTSGSASPRACTGPNPAFFRRVWMLTSGRSNSAWEFEEGPPLELGGPGSDGRRLGRLIGRAGRQYQNQSQSFHEPSLTGT